MRLLKTEKAHAGIIIIRGKEKCIGHVNGEVNITSISIKITPKYLTTNLFRNGSIFY